MEDYIESMVKHFTTYKSYAEEAIEQVPDDKLFWQYNDESNSIGIIVKHLYGNIRSRWKDFLTTDGEKSDRNRDSEFERTRDFQRRNDAKLGNFMDDFI